MSARTCIKTPTSRVSLESASITLVKGEFACIARARKVNRLALRNIRQNLCFAFGYDALGLPIAAGVLYPFGLLLSPMRAAAAISLSSVSVIAIALRLKPGATDHKVRVLVLSPMRAAAAISLSSVSVIAIALRLKHARIYSRRCHRGYFPLFRRYDKHPDGSCT